MNEDLNKALASKFEKHRIVFWYDDKQELREDFESVELDGVEKVEISNDEFQLKYRLLREEPTQKFLVFKEGPEPEGIENWLLDVQLAEGTFEATATTLLLNELGLGPEFADVVEAHPEFYNAPKSRVEPLKARLTKEDTLSVVRLKMVAVCLGCDTRVDAILEALLDEAANDEDAGYKTLQRCELTEFLWKRVQNQYGYKADEPTVGDFIIELFKSCYAMGTDGDIRLNSEALVFLKRWKDSRQHEAAFEHHSAECQEFLSISNDLGQRNFKEVIDLDYFEIIDRKILSDLVRQVQERTISPGDCAQMVRNRRQTHWYRKYQHEYDAIDTAAQLIRAIEVADLNVSSFADGIERYTQSWHKVDQLYRQFTHHFRQAHQSLLKSLAQEVNGLYTNQFLLRLCDRWQEVVDQLPKWNPDKLRPQAAFFRRHVRKFLDQNKKVCVIISDGLRYEVGQELLGLIRQGNRYTGELESMITGLPSYTQRGMASLLPHQSLEVQESTAVLVDGENSNSTAYRQKILDKLAPKVKAKALQANEFLTLSQDEHRAMTRDHNVIYIYQDIIDNVGDKLRTEKKVCGAVEDAMQELVRIVKRLASANASNMIITSDHGFLYQDDVEESDFAMAKPSSIPNDAFSRRYILGKDLPETQGLALYTAEQLDLDGETQALIPKSLNRLRKSGSGARYAHGGAMLQEIVVPVLHVNKSVTDDVNQVGVRIVRGSSNTISTGQLAVLLYQEDPISDKLQKRTLRLGLYSEDGELLSDEHELEFDFTSENAREREQRVQLVLSRAADSRNNQQVILRLNEKKPGTSQYKEYKSESYTLKRHFSSDFDFD